MKKLFIGFLSFTLLLTNVNADVQKDDKTGVYLSLISEEQNNYQYRDYNDIKYLEYTSWQNECKVDPKEYEIEYRTIYSYQYIGNINNIILSNYNSDLNISKLNIYNDLELINYNINILDDIFSINLDKEIPISNLIIEIEFDNEQELNYILTLSNNNENIYEKELNTSIFKLTFNDIYYTNIKDNKNNINYIDVTNECRYRKYLIYNYNIFFHTHYCFF